MEVIQMTKSNLISIVAESAGLTKKDTEKVVSGFLSAVTDALVSGDKVQIVGFGTFEVRDRKEREGRNPANGEPMIIPAGRVPAFKAGKSLKEAVAR